MSSQKGTLQKVLKFTFVSNGKQLLAKNTFQTDVRLQIFKKVKTRGTRDFHNVNIFTTSSKFDFKTHKQKNTTLHSILVSLIINKSKMSINT